MAVLLSGFIRNPTIEVGNAYLLAPIAAAVLGGTAISGGIGSMLAVTGAAIFLILLDQASKMLGLATSWQMIVQGLAIAAGMWLSERRARRPRATLAHQGRGLRCRKEDRRSWSARRAFGTLCGAGA
jgi:ribose transport system permease protein